MFHIEICQNVQGNHQKYNEVIFNDIHVKGQGHDLVVDHCALVNGGLWPRNIT